jgi:hypothetical protein
MREMNVVKICSIIGLGVGVVYAGDVALAPRIPGQLSSMFVNPALVPQEPGVAPGTVLQPPLSSKIRTMVVLSFFMGPFGALAGCGVGLLLDGALRTFRGKPKVTGSGAEGAENTVTGQKEK